MPTFNKVYVEGLTPEIASPIMGSSLEQKFKALDHIDRKRSFKIWSK